jgi:hypothetical protein
VPWYAWASLALNLILLAAAWHYADVARAARFRCLYWQGKYDDEHAKYRKLIESLVTKQAKDRPRPYDPMVKGSR